MKRAISLYLGDALKRVGTLHYNQDGARESSNFVYDEDWLKRDDRFEIDPLLPLQSGPQFRRKPDDGSVFHAAIADTETDGWGQKVIRRDHARRRAAARLAGNDLPPLANSMDFLLEVDGISRVGALRFRDEAGVFQRVAEASSRANPPLIELRHMLAATRAVELNEETAAELAFLRGRGTSLGASKPPGRLV